MDFRILNYAKLSTSIMCITIKIIKKIEKLLLETKHFKNIDSKQSRLFKFNRNLKLYSQFLQW